MTDRLENGECLKCGVVNLRIDKLPLCSQCEVWLRKRIAQRRKGQATRTMVLKGFGVDESWTPI